MSYIIYSDYFEDFDRQDTYEEAIQSSKDFMQRQGEDEGLGSGCTKIEIYKRIATVSGEISVKIEITEEDTDES